MVTFFCDDSQVKKCLEDTNKHKTGNVSKYIYIYFFNPKAVRPG